MKVVCILPGISMSIGLEKNITKFKVYDVIDVSYSTPDYYGKSDLLSIQIVNDVGDRYWYNMNRFVLLEEYRDSIIDKLIYT